MKRHCEIDLWKIPTDDNWMILPIIIAISAMITVAVLGMMYNAGFLGV